MRENFPILGWRKTVSECGNEWHQCIAPLSVVGDVWKITNSTRPEKEDIGLYLWNVRTMFWSRYNNKTPRGYAKTLEAAKAIVECVLINTDTCNPQELPNNLTSA
jgi:hypothetical protein